MPNHPEKTFISLDDGLYLYYDPDFINKDKSIEYFNLLNNSLVFESDEVSQIKIYGKTIKVPRKIVAFGNTGITYDFSGSSIPVNDWNNQTDPKQQLVCKILKEIRDMVSTKTGVLYNYVLINKYKDGNDYIGFHSDDEKSIRQDFGIVGISFGAQRDIVFKPNKFIPSGPFKTLDLTLENGSLIEMKYPTNLFWKHSIPKRTKIKTPRISLTFRKIV